VPNIAELRAIALVISVATHSQTSNPRIELLLDTYGPHFFCSYVSYCAQAREANATPPAKACRRDLRVMSSLIGGFVGPALSDHRQLALFAFGTARNVMVACSNVMCPAAADTPASCGMASSTPSVNS
jgi:hypothetical protein